MIVTHPRAGDAPLPSVVAGPDGDEYRIEDGQVDAPPHVAAQIADAWARRFDVDPDTIIKEQDGPPDGDALADETISEQIDDGSCPWCDDYDGDNVGTHAAQAHPEAWDDYNED